MFCFFCFNLFYWRLITLQYCIGSATHQHESATGIHVFPIPEPPSHLPPVPSLWVIPVHEPQASCIEPGLAICFLYDIIHVSVPFTQIVLPSPSPTESKRLFYTSVSLLLSRTAALILGLGRSPEGNGSSLQYSCLGNLRDRGAWWAK